MFRSTFTLATIVLALAAASCRSGPSDARRQEWDSGAGIHGKLTGYQTILSAHQGKVGFLKTYEVTEFGGPSYPWRYVQNVDHKELGFINQFGTAYIRHEYSPAEQAQQNRDARYDVLPADSIENNVMRMLGIDLTMDRLTFPDATHEDVAGDSGAPHLAGPGITPAAAPAAAPAPAPAPAK
jgi:hypothetical protein